eukprot:TRINITY_DN68798_c0_g1_i1.p2 TRINITY_DN68798_c0_g1~~TRINITY_DN68798_c0_g1_i1.p2  ORF type:complete len:107 (-),score=27.73 TRINITY_DN68798_c0_g1_i1:148-468(-)
MVYLQDFEEFQAAALTLFASQPNRTRYLMKFRHVDGKAILKVTDDKVCLKFKSNQLADLKKIQRFSQAFARWTCTQKVEEIADHDADLEDAKEAAKPQAKRKRRKG